MSDISPDWLRDLSRLYVFEDGVESTHREDSEAVRDLVLGRFHLTSLIGRGGFACVYEAMDKTTGERVAVKHVRCKSPQERDDFVNNEVIKLAEAKHHPNIVGIRAFSQLGDSVFLSTELCRYSLQERLEQPLTMSDDDIASLLRDVSSGLAHLEALGIAHHDLKPGNILWSGERWKLVDFGLASYFRERRHNRNLGGTPDYLSPALRQGVDDPHQDLWCLGTIFYQVLSGRLPTWNCEGRPEADQVIISGAWDPLSEDVDPTVKRITKRLMSIDPKSRGTASELKAEILDWLLSRASTEPIHTQGLLGSTEETLMSGRNSLGSDRDTQSRLGRKAIHPYNLHAPSEFVGRERELSDLTAWLTGQHVDPAVSRASILILRAVGGAGKSSLTWRWFDESCEEAIQETPLVGRFWFSFYNDDPKIAFDLFLRHCYAYVSGTELNESRSRAEVERLLLEALVSDPILIVMDGIERIMNAYARVGSRGTEEGDDEAGDDDEPKVSRWGRRLADGDGEFLHTLLSLRQLSKVRILATSRLLPADFEVNDGDLIDEAAQISVGGLRAEDALKLWNKFVKGSFDRARVTAIMKEFGFHPIVIRILASSVAETEGGLDAWLRTHKDFNPATHPDLKTKRAHVLEVSMRGLQEVPSVFGTLLFICTSSFAKNYKVLARNLVERRRMFSGPEAFMACLDLLVDRGVVGRTGRFGDYDAHPIVRSYVYGKATDPQATRRDNLKDLLSEMSDIPGDVKEVEDLAQAEKVISYYKLLVEDDRIDDAWDLFSRKLFPAFRGILVMKASEIESLLDELFPKPTLSLPYLSQRFHQAEALSVRSRLLAEMGDIPNAERMSRWAGAMHLQRGDYKEMFTESGKRAWGRLYTGSVHDTSLHLARTFLQIRNMGVMENAGLILGFLAIAHAIAGRDAFGIAAQGTTDALIATKSRWLIQTIAEALFYLGKYEAALTTVVRAYEVDDDELANEVKQLSWEKVTEGMALVGMGRYKEADAPLREAVDLARESGYGIVGAFALVFQALSALGRGNLARVQDRLSRYFELPYSQGFHAPAAEAFIVKARAWRDLKRPVSEIQSAVRSAWGHALEHDGSVRYARAVVELETHFPGSRPNRLTLGQAEESIPGNDEVAVDAKEIFALFEPNDGASVPAPEKPVVAVPELAEKCGMSWASREARDWWERAGERFSEGWVEHTLDRLVSAGLYLQELYDMSRKEPALSVELLLSRALLARQERDLEKKRFPQKEGPDAWVDATVAACVAWAETPHARIQAFIAHGFDAIDRGVFQRDAERRIFPEEATPEVRAWWSNLIASQGDAYAALALSEELLGARVTLDRFLEGMKTDHGVGFRLGLERLHFNGALLRERLRPVSSASGWPERQLHQGLDDAMFSIGWLETFGAAKQWWKAFRKENHERLSLVLRLAEELSRRRTSVTEFHLAYVYSATDNIQGNLHYMDFRNIKSAEEALADNGDRSSGNPSVDSAREMLDSWIHSGTCSRYPVRRLLPAEEEKLAEEAALYDAEIEDNEARMWFEMQQEIWKEHPLVWNRFLVEMKTNGIPAEDVFMAALRSQSEHPGAWIQYACYVKLRLTEAARKRAATGEESPPK